MSGLMVGAALVIGLAGVMMFVAPQTMTDRLSLATLPTDPASIRMFRIGGSVLIALAAALLIQLLSE